jgi:hypothetical protein
MSVSDRPKLEAPWDELVPQMAAAAVRNALNDPPPHQPSKMTLAAIAREAAFTAEQRREYARKAIEARWSHR